jgi:hypothetical protein
VNVDVRLKAWQSLYKGPVDPIPSSHTVSISERYHKVGVATAHDWACRETLEPIPCEVGDADRGHPEPVSHQWRERADIKHHSLQQRLASCAFDFGKPLAQLTGQVVDLHACAHANIESFMMRGNASAVRAS